MMASNVRRLSRYGIVCLAFSMLAVASPRPAVADEEAPVDYARDVKPLLSDRCYACHGPDPESREADIRLDDRESAVEYAIVPEESSESPLVERLTTDDPDLLMPPPESNRPALTPQQVDLIRRWIDQGAEFDTHWSYATPQRPTPPTPKSQAWPHTPVNAFVLDRLEREKLTPSPKADRRTLIRRLCFDLTGLPPTAEQVDAFVADNSPEATLHLVDRLLASPHFGERMALYWLDLVRFADTNGIHGDNHREHTPYRDYVIAAFNENMPFDRFTVEQIAGDLLPDRTSAQWIASGYNRLNLTTREGGAQPKEYMAKYAADRVRNIGSVWLGSTMTCAECHDHKYDPFTMHDFYSMAAWFADLQETAVGEQKPMRVPTPEQAQQIGEIERQLKVLQAQLEADPDQAETVKAQIEQLDNQRKQIDGATRLCLVSVTTKPRTMRVLPRGNWLDETGPVVQPEVPHFLPALPDDAPRNRLTLARWLVDRQNPLVARVTVNRLWQLLFGVGLAPTADDFGAQGDRPSHPELLDWLAVELIESDWDVKHILRLIVTSDVYQQSSLADKELLARDPQNRLLARQGRFRLDAELVRDNALAVSGLLVPAVGGRSVKPYQPAGYWSHLNFPKRTYQADRGENLYRRGLYTYWCRTFLHPSLAAFDAPSREECVVRRNRSNTPLQALVLLNDPIYVEAARKLAQRMIAEGGQQPAERAAFAVRTVLQRDITPHESETLIALYRKHLDQYQQDEQAAKQIIAIGAAPADPAIPPAELAAWTSVARVVLNLHETITRY